MQVRLEKEGQPFWLENRPLARGGEATLYELPGRPTLVAKVYHQPTVDHAHKLAAMIANPPADPMAGTGHISIAWPTDRLLTAAAPAGFLGFVMPRVARAWTILEFYNPKARLQLCPLFHYGYLLRTARNLAAAVRAVHEKGYVIGDLNESNVLVNNQALVAIVDTDSFQVPDQGRVFRCAVGKPEYTPPELQGTQFAGFDRGPENDAFALAVLIFQLLMQGVHPFAGRFTGQGEPATLDHRIAAGHWPYAQRRQVPYAPTPLAPPFSTLPPSVQALMRRCFEEGHARSGLRPDASTWFNTLKQVEQEMAACHANAQHLFHRSLGECPWCRLAQVQKRDPFPSKEDVEAGRVGAAPAAGAQVALTPAPMGSPLAVPRRSTARAVPPPPPVRAVPPPVPSTAVRDFAGPPEPPVPPSDLGGEGSGPRSHLIEARPFPQPVPIPTGFSGEVPAGPNGVTFAGRPPELVAPPPPDFPLSPWRRFLRWPWLTAAGGLLLALLLWVVLPNGGKNDSGGKGEYIAVHPDGQGKLRPEDPPKKHDPDPEMIQLMLDLKSADNNRRGNAVRRLAQMRPDENRAEVARALEELLQNPRTRDGVPEALAVWGTKESVPVLAKALAASQVFGEVFYRQALLRALGNFKDERAAEAAASRLHDHFENGEATIALEKIGSAGEPALIRLLKHPDAGTRERVCNILKVVGSKKSIAPLQEATKDANGGVARAAEQAWKIIAARQ
jgi:hypothetical protein